MKKKPKRQTVPEVKILFGLTYTRKKTKGKSLKNLLVIVREQRFYSSWLEQKIETFISKIICSSIFTKYL
jgi:hypothetical protein